MSVSNIKGRFEMRRPAKLATAIGIASALIFGTAPVRAQDYPTKEITAICPFGPGTGADILVRFFSAKLSDMLGKPVVVINRPGATGAIATEAVARSRPDGYTIAITPASSTMAAASHLFKKLPFDPIKDFAPITTLSTLPFVLIVSGKSPVRSVADLVASIKAKTKGGFYGGSNNTGIVASELFKRAAGITVERVAYKSIADIVNDMGSGQLDYTFIDASWVPGQMSSGRIRPLAVTSAKRSSVLPDVPTFAEAGFPGVELTAWWGVFVAAKTPQPIVDKLAGAFNKILALPETKAFLGKIASEPMPGTPASLRELLVKEVVAWGQRVKLAGIEPQ